MTVYEASRVIKTHLKQIIPDSTVQTSGVIGLCKGEILKFKSVQQAIHLNGGNGYIFEYLYRNGEIELTPVD